MSEDNLNSRKGIPIKSPHERLQSRRSTSSHDLLSPLNTLDRSAPSPRLTVKPRVFTPMLPLKLEKLPNSYTGSATSIDELMKKYPSDTFSTDEDTLKNVTVQRGSLASFTNEKTFDIASAYTSEEDEDDDEKKSKDTTLSPYSVSKIQAQSQTIRKPQTTFSRSNNSDEKKLHVSTIQFRNAIIPSSRSIYTYTNFKLIFLQKQRVLVISCIIDSLPNSAVLNIPYSKVHRIQFSRKECSPSSDWYIDFVLAPEFAGLINLKPFKAPPESTLTPSQIQAYADVVTLRVHLDYNCGLSVNVIDNILLSILNDRKAFYFTENKDKYGEFQTTNLTSSPDRPRKSLSYSFSSSVINSSPRTVPSLESLYASDSVKLKSRRKTVIEDDDQIYAPKMSPDVFESSTRRQSKRTRSSTSTVPTSPSKVAEFTYVDPDFESDCIKLFSYPEGDLDSVQVTSHELQRLEPGIWLNDTLIDFELKYLLHQLDKNIQEKIHIFSSFFYRRLSSAKMTQPKSDDSSQNKKTGYELVNTWTRKVNLFEKDFVVLPINENLHWYLAIICYPSKMLTDLIEEETEFNEQEDMDKVDINESVPIVDLDAEDDRTRIFIFDSLGLTSRGKSTTVINRLRTYLQLEAQDKLGRATSKSACTGHVIKVPQQENYTDCGCFLLQFVDEFFKAVSKSRQPDRVVDRIIEANYDLSLWFPSHLAQDRRNVMKERIQNLAADYAARQKLKHAEDEKEKEDRSSDIEEIIM